MTGDDFFIGVFYVAVFLLFAVALPLTFLILGRGRKGAIFFVINFVIYIVEFAVLIFVANMLVESGPLGGLGALRAWPLALMMIFHILGVFIYSIVALATRRTWQMREEHKAAMKYYSSFGQQQDQFRS